MQIARYFCGMMTLRPCNTVSMRLRNPHDSFFAFHHGYRVLGAEMRAHPAADAAVFSSAGFFIVVYISGVGMAYLLALPAPDAEIVVDHG